MRWSFNATPLSITKTSLMRDYSPIFQRLFKRWVMQAYSVVAIDNDDWAFANALDNMEKNDATEVTVIQGDIHAIPLPGYDIIVANINRNVLLQDIPGYTEFLNNHGTLLMSGFYEQDLDHIRDVAEKSGLRYIGHKTDNKWVGVKFEK